MIENYTITPIIPQKGRQWLKINGLGPRIGWHLPLTSFVNDVIYNS